ncbi:imelysin family protein [Lentibacter algarum]|uniref:imelysin family protein n=1 Tax=Lentibacter algarum TaxID=576131 RepID=UPI001C095799|nr:imelysin family protein [Lentibacter algarum]MBU2983367.1 imelysin family protein [Lentibacter algarum]
MRYFAYVLALLVTPLSAQADSHNALIEGIVEAHILPGFEALATQSQALSKAAEESCDPASDTLRQAYGRAFDAWVSVSHLRFGPTEVNDRAFALAFWPDSRGVTPRALAGLLSEQDPIASSVTDYAQVSIAARGFYALEFLLYDDRLMTAGEAGYHCTLVQTISADIALTSKHILEGWQSGYAVTMLTPSPDGVYQTDKEVLQTLFKSLATGLEFTADTRLGRPLGSFDRPRPTRAEARRSGRSSRHVMLSLEALSSLAAHLAEGDKALSGKLEAAFERAQSQLADLNDPVFAGVSNPQSRLKIEIVQQGIAAIRTIVRDEMGPALGVAAGFNALDGD